MNTWCSIHYSLTFTEDFQFTEKLQGEKERKRLRKKGGREGRREGEREKTWKSGERKGRLTDFEIPSVESIEF